jgi:1,4-dihydroxy-2-naphthoate octaprenyltransferase
LVSSLLSLARPRAALLVSAATVIGYGFGLWEHALPLTNFARLPVVFIAWLALHAGTMWLNAALDRDRGAVLFGQSTAVPDGLGIWAYVALAVAVALAVCADLRAGLCALVAAGLSILYSNPRTRWKRHPLLGPCVNAVGYGVLTPAAGWVLVEAPLGGRTLATATLLMATALSVYFIGQVFQGEEDRQRRDRTLVATHGAGAVISATRVCLAYAGFGVTVMCIVGWFPRVCLLACPAWPMLDGWLVRAARRGPLEEVQARGFVRRLSMFGLLLLLASIGSYLGDIYRGGSVAGQATSGALLRRS